MTMPASRFLWLLFEDSSSSPPNIHPLDYDTYKLSDSSYDSMWWFVFPLRMPPTQIHILFALCFYSQCQLTLLLEGEDLHIGAVLPLPRYHERLFGVLLSMLQIQNLPMSLARVNRHTALSLRNFYQPLLYV